MIQATTTELETYKLIKKTLNDSHKKWLDAQQIKPIIKECKEKLDTCHELTIPLVESAIKKLLGKRGFPDEEVFNKFIEEEPNKLQRLTKDVAFLEEIFEFEEPNKEVVKEPIEEAVKEPIKEPIKEDVKKKQKKYVGVRTKKNKWVSEIRLSKTAEYFGAFQDQEEAARSNDQARVHIFGPTYPREQLNFPEDWEKYLNEKNKSKWVKYRLERNKGEFYLLPMMKKKEYDCLNILSSLKDN